MAVTHQVQALVAPSRKIEPPRGGGALQLEGSVGTTKSSPNAPGGSGEVIIVDGMGMQKRALHILELL